MSNHTQSAMELRNAAMVARLQVAEAMITVLQSVEQGMFTADEAAEEFCPELFAKAEKVGSAETLAWVRDTLAAEEARRKGAE